MNFSDCPVCQNEYLEELCPTCKGSGMRPITAEAISLAITAKEWADERVSEFFDSWCRISGTHPAYGVESWQIWGEELRIVQDTSCRGCHRTESHDFPLAWLLATEAEREALIEADVAQKKAAEAARHQREKQQEIARLQSRLATLQSGGTA